MIRTAETKDIQQITNIYNYYILHSVASFEITPVNAEEIERRMREILQTGPYLVFTDDTGRVLGYCYIHPWKERQAYCRTFEITVYVHPSHYRKGIGSALLTRIIEECGQSSVHALVACITASNHASISLHEKFGFIKVSHFHEVGIKFGLLLDVEDYELIIKNESR